MWSWLSAVGQKKERERDGQRVCVRALGYWEQRKGEEDGREILIRLWWFLTDDRRDQPSANGSKSLSTNRATPALLSPLCICALSYAYLCETACVSLSPSFLLWKELTVSTTLLLLSNSSTAVLNAFITRFVGSQCSGAQTISTRPILSEKGCWPASLILCIFFLWILHKRGRR